MPTDLLFEYDSDTLRPEAAQTLEKLGSLIKKNEQADFKIEGHTDSFGTEDYNNALSLRRAEAVKRWLQETMKITGNRIATVGLGKSHLLVPATGTVQQQQLNRRVEIVISTRSGT
jgi:OmpA-OmpF porin, OOP family